MASRASLLPSSYARRRHRSSTTSCEGGNVMSQIASGPLPALVRYYERLNGEPNGNIAEFGFSREKIHFEIVLNKDGSRNGFNDVRIMSDRGKSIPNLLLVPDSGGRSGTG